MRNVPVAQWDTLHIPCAYGTSVCKWARCGGCSRKAHRDTQPKRTGTVEIGILIPTKGISTGGKWRAFCLDFSQKSDFLHAPLLPPVCVQLPFTNGFKPRENTPRFFPFANGRDI